MSCSTCCPGTPVGCLPSNRGFTGPTGAGPTGPTGSSTPFADASYLSAFDEGSTLASGANIPFAGVGSIAPVGIANAAGVFTFANAGTYAVSVTMTVVETSVPRLISFQAMQNGGPLAEAWSLSLETALQWTMMGGPFLITVGAGDTLAFGNTTAGADVNLQQAFLSLIRIS